MFSTSHCIPQAPQPPEGHPQMTHDWGGSALTTAGSFGSTLRSYQRGLGLCRTPRAESTVAAVKKRRRLKTQKETMLTYSHRHHCQLCSWMCWGCWRCLPGSSWCVLLWCPLRIQVPSSHLRAPAPFPRGPASSQHLPWLYPLPGDSFGTPQPKCSSRHAEKGGTSCLPTDCSGEHLQPLSPSSMFPYTKWSNSMQCPDWLPFEILLDNNCW